MLAPTVVSNEYSTYWHIALNELLFAGAGCVQSGGVVTGLGVNQSVHVDDDAQKQISVASARVEYVCTRTYVFTYS